VYLGGFDSEAEAAFAYDLAAVKFRGAASQTNFSMANYAPELAARDQVRLLCVARAQGRAHACLTHIGRAGAGVRALRHMHEPALPLHTCTHAQVRGEDLVAVLRRQSRGPAAPTTSSFRGVTRHAKGK
jgi:hypothetical protein